MTYFTKRNMQLTQKFINLLSTTIYFKKQNFGKLAELQNLKNLKKSEANIWCRDLTSTDKSYNIYTSIIDATIYFSLLSKYK